MVDQSLDPQKLSLALQKEVEWSKCVIFDEKCSILCEKNCKAQPEELKEYLGAYENRNKTVGKGFKLLGQNYEVHRFHPPLIYGRKGDAEIGEGISLCKGKSKSGQTIYMIIAYELPIVSARAVPQQIQFFNTEIGQLEQF